MGILRISNLFLIALKEKSKPDYRIRHIMALKYYKLNQLLTTLLKITLFNHKFCKISIIFFQLFKLEGSVILEEANLESYQKDLQ